MVSINYISDAESVLKRCMEEEFISFSEYTDYRIYVSAPVMDTKCLLMDMLPPQATSENVKKYFVEHLKISVDDIEWVIFGTRERAAIIKFSTSHPGKSVFDKIWQK